MGQGRASRAAVMVKIIVRFSQFARRSLLRVLVVAPGEPAVLMQLGKACKHLGLLEEAVRIVWLVCLE